MSVMFPFWMVTDTRMTSPKPKALPLLDKMLEVQSAEVDTVSGATLTAEGLIGAVADALGKAAE